MGSFINLVKYGILRDAKYGMDEGLPTMVFVVENMFLVRMVGILYLEMKVEFHLLVVED